MRAAATIGALAVAAVVLPAEAPAWESATTNAGLTEQAALSSQLHQKVAEQLGAGAGLYTRLRIPRPDAAPLFAVFDKLNPAHGYVPGAKGRQTALAWLAAGAAIADSPPAHAANHFFDPRTGQGLDRASISGTLASVRHRVNSRTVGEQVVVDGIAAPKWIEDGNNPMGVAGFHDQYRKAVRSRSPGERERHTAGALLAAGALAHALEDMASPSHVRNDLRAHLERLSDDRTDVGSRFERVAALAFGRLGVPGPTEVIRRDRVRDFFASDDGTGLADVIAKSYFSAGSLPREVRVKRRMGSAAAARLVATALKRPEPTISQAAPLSLRRAAAPGGARLENAAGVCLAHYHLDGERLYWSIPDRCAIEQLGAILPLAVGYAAGLLDHLFRGGLEVSAAGGGLEIRPTGLGLGEGKLAVYWDDSLGVRTRYATIEKIAAAADKATIATVPVPPEGAVGIAVLFEGVDDNGEIVSAAATYRWPLPAPDGK